MALVLIMGVPGSGKTYLGKRLLAKFGELCCLFSFDEMYNDDQLMAHLWGHNDQQSSLLGLYGINSEKTAHSERKRCEAKVRDYLSMHFHAKQTSELNRHRPIVIVDDIFYLSSMRRPFERMAHMYRIAYIIIYIDVPLECALRQNEARAQHQRIPEYMIRNIWERIEMPRTSATVTVLKYSGEESLDELGIKIKTIALNHMVIDTCKVDTSCNNNQSGILEHDSCWEKLEIELRKIVGELVKVHKDGRLARALTIAKRELANELRANDIREWHRQQLKELLTKKVKATCLSLHTPMKRNA